MAPDTEHDPFAEKERDLALDGIIQAIDHCDHGLRIKDDRGVQMILDGLLRAAKQAGLRELSPALGSPFDPHLMEALGSEYGPFDENTVAAVSVRGWQHRDRNLRLPRVVVSKGPEEFHRLPAGSKGRRRRGKK